MTLTGVNGLSWVAISDSTGTTQYSGRIRQGEAKTFTDNQLKNLNQMNKAELIAKLADDAGITKTQANAVG